MPADEEESSEGFTFRDRRRTAVPDAPEAAVPAADAPSAQPPAQPLTAAFGMDDALTDEDAASLLAGDESAGAGELPDVYSVLALFLGELRNLAWLRMGLVANPGTGQIERDLPQAKVAIDTVAFLAQQLEPTVAPQERLPLRALVSDLQINFVEQTKRL